MSFKSVYNRGFQMTFGNGITISVQWGTGNYCSRKDLNSPVDGDLKYPTTESPTAEIAIWHRESDTWFEFETDQVRGWCNTDEVGGWITLITNATDLNNLRELALINSMLK